MNPRKVLLYVIAASILLASTAAVVDRFHPTPGGIRWEEMR